MRFKITWLAVFIISFSLIIPFNACSPEDQEEDLQEEEFQDFEEEGLVSEEDEPVSEEDEPSEAIQEAFQKAINDVEAVKIKEHEVLKEALRVKLDEAVKEWLSSQEKEKSAQLNKLVEQEWEKLFEFGPYVHYDYFLRDYSYQEVSRDIVKTESMVFPYAGIFEAREKLFVERTHLPGASYREQFLFTVTAPVKVKYEYREGEFVFIDSEYGRPKIEAKWLKK